MTREEEIHRKFSYLLVISVMLRKSVLHRKWFLPYELGLKGLSGLGDFNAGYRRTKDPFSTRNQRLRDCSFFKVTREIQV
jgi:hypothetical protein